MIKTAPTNFINIGWPIVIELSNILLIKKAINKKTRLIPAPFNPTPNILWTLLRVNILLLACLVVYGYMFGK
jgi:hypothetical protein